MSIELDGNGNTVRSSPVVADSDLSKQIRSAGQADLIKEIEDLRNELVKALQRCAGEMGRGAKRSMLAGYEVQSLSYESNKRVYLHAGYLIEQKFSALLSKIKN